MSKRLFSRIRLNASRITAWVGVVAVMATMLMPSMAYAAQLTSRSLTLGSSAASGVTTYLFTFNPGTTGNIGAVKFEICDSPLENTSCANTGNSAGASFTSNSASLTGQTGISGFTVGTGTPAAPTTNTFWITKASPSSVSNATPVTVTLTNVRNPSATNTSFYAKITTYSDAAGTALVDFGGIAVSTANQVTVSANVQESLTFCVYTGINCAAGGSAVNLGVGADNVLSTATPSGGVSMMDADTNATTGYVITYLASNLASTNDTITAAGGTAGTFTAGTAKFGINLRDNATPDIGVDITGTGTGAVGTQYNTVDNFAFVPTTATSVASTVGPTLPNTYTVAYAAQAGNTTKPGSYSTTFTWVCTGTF